MRPHEEEWTNYQSGAANNGITERGSKRVVATRITTYDAAMLISAAPDMARWMLSQGEPLCKSGEWHLKTCGGACDPECTEYRAALTKAGVLP